jgi:hypothetical protein
MKREIQENGKMHLIMENIKRDILASKITEAHYGSEILK